MEVYAFAGIEHAADPRLTSQYEDLVAKGCGLEEPERWAHLGAADRVALGEWVQRKAGAFW